MRDCVILINDRLVSLSHTTHSSLTHNSLLLTRVSLSHTTHSSSPESSVRLKKSVLFGWFFLRNISWYLSMTSWREGLYVCLLIIMDTMSGHLGQDYFWKLSCPWEHLLHIDRWDTVCLKTKKSKGNKTRSCHIILNSFSAPSSTKRCHSPAERLDHLRISSLTA